jgi:hypothetical protein
LTRSEIGVIDESFVWLQCIWLLLLLRLRLWRGSRVRVLLDRRCGRRHRSRQSELCSQVRDFRLELLFAFARQFQRGRSGSGCNGFGRQGVVERGLRVRVAARGVHLVAASTSTNISISTSIASISTITITAAVCTTHGRARAVRGRSEVGARALARRWRRRG